MTDAFHAFGADLTFAAGPVGEVGDISGPEIAVGEEEVTHHGSTDGWQEFIPNLKNAGTVTFAGNFTDTAIDTLQGHIDDETVGPVVLTLANDASWECDGFVTAIGTDTPVEGKEGYSVTFKLTGKPTFAANDPRYKVVFNEDTSTGGAVIFFYGSTKTANDDGISIFAGIPDGTHHFTATGGTNDTGDVTVDGKDMIEVYDIS